MNKHTITVNSMKCDGCVSTIQGSLEADDRIQDIDIQLSKKLVIVTGDLSEDQAAGIIIGSGHTAEPTAEKKGLFSGFFSR